MNLKINKNETYEEMVARQKAERKEMKRRLATEKQQEMVRAAERLLAVVRIFHDGKDDMEIAALYIAKMKDKEQKAKVDEAYAAISKINKKRK